MLKINGWTLYAHPLFLDQLDRLMKAVESEMQKNPDTYRGGSNAKLLASIKEIAFKRIPADPTDKRYRQASTLGDDYKHWFRDKFGNGRFRLFFRYDAKAKLIIYAWVNDDDSKRTFGSKNDAYAVFKKMLDAGNPPDNWDKLLSQCSADQLAVVTSEADDL
jgi:toxin YhaV